MNRKPEWWLVLAALLVLVVGAIFFSRIPPENDGTRQVLGARESLFLNESPSERAAESAESEQSGRLEQLWAEEEAAELRRLLPTKEQVREEVARNPHVVPSSVVDYAQRLGEWLERASQDRDLALELGVILEECVRNGEVADSVRILCFRQASRLQEFYPDDAGVEVLVMAIRDAAPDSIHDQAGLLDGGSSS